MALPEVLMALLREEPQHGYDLKRDHDAWFPEGRPLAFGQVYATLTRLQKQGLVAVAGTDREAGPERTSFELTDQGRERLAAWLATPADVSSSGTDEIVRKTIVALHSGEDPAPVLARQRAAHLQRMRELLSRPTGDELASRLARDHLVARLDADLRWLETAAERVAQNSSVPSPRPQETP